MQDGIRTLLPGAVDKMTQIILKCGVGIRVAGRICLFIIVAELNQQEVAGLQPIPDGCPKTLVLEGLGAAAVVAVGLGGVTLPQEEGQRVRHTLLGVGADLIEGDSAVANVEYGRHREPPVCFGWVHHTIFPLEYPERGGNIWSKLRTHKHLLNFEKK